MSFWKKFREREAMAAKELALPIFLLPLLIVILRDFLNRNKKESKQTSEFKYALFFFAGYHKAYTWVVTGTPTQLRLLDQYGKKMTPRKRILHEESWGSYLINTEPISTDTARKWIRAIVEYKDFDFENWFPVSLEWDNSCLENLKNGK